MICIVQLKKRNYRVKKIYLYILNNYLSGTKNLIMPKTLQIVFYSALSSKYVMCQKGIDLNHDFYVVVGKQCRTENVNTGNQHNIFIHIFIILMF